MSQRFEESIAIFKRGVSQATSGTAAGSTIPTTLSGTVPLYIRVASTQAAYFAIGSAGVTAAAGDILIQPADAVILATNGSTNYSAIQVTAAGVVQISPLENM